MIIPYEAFRVAMAFWPIEEKAAASNDIATTDLIETGPARELADAVSCEDLILGAKGVRTVRAIHTLNVYVPRQTSYPAHFLAEIVTTVYGRIPTGYPPGTFSPPGTPFLEMLVFVRSSLHSPWKVDIDTGYTGGTTPDGITPEGGVLRAPGFEAPAPQPGWIAPASVPGLLAQYWQHWSTAGGPPPGSSPFAAGRWTTVQGNYLAKGKPTELARGIISNTRYFANPAKDGVYQFAVDGEDLVCFAVRFHERLTPVETGAVLLQGRHRNQYGALLAPGSYPVIYDDGLHQSCAFIPLKPNQPADTTAGKGIMIVGGQGGDTSTSG